MECFQNMDVNKVNDNQMFQKTMNPRFSNKCKTYFDRREYDYKK